MRNGYLPDSVLAPIPGGRLRRDCAALWNAMCQQAGGGIFPMGSLSSYRNYAGQVLLYGRSRPGWAARPGTSNHGWGQAVDLRTTAMRAKVDRHGAPYGIAKKWSDASWEWWHLKVNPGLASKKPRVRKKFPYPTLHKGYVKPRKYTRLAQRCLANAGYPSVEERAHYGQYDRYTRTRVKRFQRAKGLRADGQIGPKTWRRLLRHRPK